jgi:hypothetical protein
LISAISIDYTPLPSTVILGAIKKVRRSAMGAILALAALGLVPDAPAQAGLFFTAAVGGAPTGVVKENFDTLTPGSLSTTTLPSGITISFQTDAKPVQGSSSGLYAAPFLSGTNGAGFGPAGSDQVSGADTTVYITSGSTGAVATAQVTLQLPAPEQYFGLLWGSVDAYNTLSFYNGTTLIGSVTGSDVTSSPNGDQGINGTLYVNIDATDGAVFDRVVATSSQYAFEFDDVAFNPTTVSLAGDPVPEPMSLGVLATGLLGVVLMRRRQMG